jgi:preprotein translocase subunit SecA
MNGVESLAPRLALERFFLGRDKPRQAPLGWDWIVGRCELLFVPRPQARLLLAQAAAVLDRESLCAPLSDKVLRENIAAMRALFRLGRESEADRLAALALLREAAFRTLGEKPYLTQMAGALGLMRDCVVEMATGEGKTLTAALAATVAGWRGMGCHVLTANDYLAGRDEAAMRPFYQACGVSSAAVTQGCAQEERRSAYACAVTYLTSKEAAADFLRDQMALGQTHSYAHALIDSLAAAGGGGASPLREKPQARLVQRGLFRAIVDEADSVLCDGGSTPLIISVAADNAPAAEQYLAASALAETLRRGADYKINQRFREAKLTDPGRKKVMRSLSAGTRAWAAPARALELTTQAVEAREFFQQAVQYVIQDGKAIIVDEATGRIMPDHEWRDGMHQAVAAKEGLEVRPPRATNAQTTFQDFFLRYKSLGGMTGTAWEARRELLQFYNAFVVRMPTHKPCLRTVEYRAFHAAQAEKLRDVARLAGRCRDRGRPVLVGTRSIGASEKVSAALREAGIPHEVLNAVQHEREAEIVAKAGQAGAVTVATNMAGRGTDIKLGQGVRELGGLLVILTEMHESRRIDRQLHGRAGRQGDPGSVAEIICLEDEIFTTVPRPALRLLRLLGRAGKPLRLPFLAWKTAAWCQWLGNRRAFRLRRQMVLAGRKFAEMISYSGKQI